MTTHEHSILLVDDETDALRSMELTLNMAGFPDVIGCATADDAIGTLRSRKLDLVILDIVMPRMSGMELLKTVKETDPELPVIMVTGIAEIDTAIRCIRDGALDYIAKPMEGERFLTSVKNALRIRDLQIENSSLTTQLLSAELKFPQAFSRIASRNRDMFMIFKYVEAIAPTNHPVLITGETGVGKELIARAVHETSGLTGRFEAVNVAGIDDTAFSDTMFGHARGAFTGAESARKGLVEVAADGTLFLDEIGDLSIQSQVKLLRLLQEAEYRPLGSDRTMRSNARIVAATCKSIDDLQSSQHFRKDLFYRLRAHHIALPPLRKRKDDISFLAELFVAGAARELNKKVPDIPQDLHTLLHAYEFPGNVRELQNMVFDAMSNHSGPRLSLRPFREKTGIAAAVNGTLSRSGATDGTDSERVVFPERLPTLREIENALVEEALTRTRGNRSQAADLLGITRQALGHRLNKMKTDRQPHAV